jgi:citrate lyase subunit beta/citryl-CoA lyase
MKWRSWLFVPGDRPDQMAKAEGAGADVLILDLEDAVAPLRKPEARLHVAQFLGKVPRTVRIFVRTNPIEQTSADADLAAMAAAMPDGFVLPKASGAASILEFERRTNALGLPARPILPIATETALSIFRLAEYPSVAARLAGLTWGAEDLPAAIGAMGARLPDGSFTAPFEMVRALSLFAAHAAGVPAIDTVYPAFRDLAGLAQYAKRGMHDGFSGMLAIHPAQVPIINDAFTPTAAAVDHARRVVAAFKAEAGAGVIALDGAMLDAPHLKQAERILAQAEAAS